MELVTLGTTIINYAAKGGMIAAGGGMLIISLAVTAGYLPQPTSERLLNVLGNYFLIGAVIGALVGLIVALRERQ
ncbi:MAG: hypothetical protein P8169_05060 [Chloroflexota bacterium]|jgi:hypothetical protein